MRQSEHLSALAAGARLNIYVVERVLGAGGFGITYRAREDITERAVAIKEYLPSSLAVRDGASVRPVSDDFEWGLGRFRQEAKLLIGLKHPNIVPVLSYFEANGTGYLVMEFQTGRSLGDVLAASATIDERDLLELLSPLLDGVEAVHKHGFLHRDIKPDNIFVRQDGLPVLLDFGNARQALGQHSRNLTAVLTEGYAPYEQYHGDGDLGPWTDIYALGAVMFRCLTGDQPAEAPKRVEARFANAPDPLTECFLALRANNSAQTCAALEAALGLRADERPKSVGELRRLLWPPRAAANSDVPSRHETLTAGSPPARREFEIPAAPERATRRGRVATYATLGVVLFVGGAFGAYMIAGRNGPVTETQPGAVTRMSASTEAEEAERRADERRRAEEAARWRKFDEQRRADTEAQRKAEEQEARRESEQRRREEERLRAEEEAKKKTQREFEEKAAEEVARRLAEVETRRAADEAGRRKAEEEERARIERRRLEQEREQAEQERRRKAAQEAQRKADAGRKAEEERTKLEAQREKAEEEARRKAGETEQAERTRVEAEVKRKAEAAKQRAEQAAALAVRARNRLATAAAALHGKHYLDAQRAAADGAAALRGLGELAAAYQDLAALRREHQALDATLKHAVAGRVSELVREAQAAMKSSRFSDAKRRLDEATALEPQSKEIAAALSELATMARAETPRTPEGPRTPYDRNDLRRYVSSAYEKMMGRILSGTLGSSGQPNPYRTVPKNKAMAACIDWAASFPDTISYKGWHFAGQRTSELLARSDAEAYCRQSFQNRGCTCVVIDVNDRNVLELPESFLQQRFQ